MTFARDDAEALKTMSIIRTGLTIGLTMLGLVPVAACTLASPTHITVEQQEAPKDGGASKSSSGDSKSSSPTSATCAADDFTKPDVASLKACGQGKGHCFAKDKVALGDQFEPCEGSDVCVPDEILSANGQKLKSCKSIIGEGGCVNTSLIPEVKKQGGDVLTQDVCDAGQKCIPCTDPTHNNAPSGFCEPIGVHTNACTAGGDAPAGGGDKPAAALPGCCTSKGKSNGVCLTETAIPEDQRGDAPQDSCADGNKCVPAAFVEGKPVKCDGGILGAGVCMDKCFNGMMSIAGDIGILDNEGCGNTEVCVPCRFLKDKGVPGCQ
jgi:hypothetical protein